MKRIYCVFLLTIIVCVGCVVQRTSTIVSCDYNRKKNQTNYIVFPYGSVSLPGKWEKGRYSEVSTQQFFINSDSVIIAIAFGLYNKYEFNQDGAKKGFDFVRAFYEWDSDYFVNTYGLKQDLIEENEINNYIIWRLYGDYNNSHWDTYFLFGENNGFVRNYSIMTTDKWTVEQKIEFLKGIYGNKKE